MWGIFSSIYILNQFWSTSLVEKNNWSRESAAWSAGCALHTSRVVCGGGQVWGCWGFHQSEVVRRGKTEELMLIFSILPVLRAVCIWSLSRLHFLFLTSWKGHCLLSVWHVSEERNSVPECPKTGTRGREIHFSSRKNGNSSLPAVTNVALSIANMW